MHHVVHMDNSTHSTYGGSLHAIYLYGKYCYHIAKLLWSPAVSCIFMCLCIFISSLMCFMCFSDSSGESHGIY